ncbi:MAG: hypothetical protein OQL27_03975, partial [Sedimenticola sp.]|nr:hypothetical protein [Sedimenticola sp.]
SGQGTAMLCYTMPWKCRVDGVDPGAANRVNPGSREGGGFVPAPRINPGESIVVNPNPDSAPSAPNLEAAKQLQKEGIRRRDTGVDDPRGDR